MPVPCAAGQDVNVGYLCQLDARGLPKPRLDARAGRRAIGRQVSLADHLALGILAGQTRAKKRSRVPARTCGLLSQPQGRTSPPTSKFDLMKRQAPPRLPLEGA